MTKTFINSALLITLLPIAGNAGSQQPRVNASAASLAGFTARVAAYADLRKRLEKGDAKLKPTNEAGELDAARKALAARIQAARPAAKLGEIFTVDSRSAFRRLLSPPLKGTDGAENKGAIKEDNPGALAIKVNAPYPSKEPLSTVPPDVLKALPVLPDDLDYRFVGKHLILYDTKAGLVVDYIPNAIP